MKKIPALLIALLLAVSATAGNDGFRLEAHRGVSARFPENTILAFKEAAKIKYYAGIETDVQMTKDGVIVLMHDNTLDRTTDGTGAVSNYTYEELKQFHIDGGSGWNDKYAGKYRIPKFESYLKIMRDCGKIPYVELKLISEEGIRKTVELLHKYGFTDDKYVLTSFKKDYLIYASTISSAKKEYMRRTFTDEDIDDCASREGWVLRPSCKHLTKEFVDKCKVKGVEVECYGIPVGKIDMFCRIKSWGVQGGTCNDYKNLGVNWQYTDAALFIANKLIHTKNPYHRLDVDECPGLTKGEAGQAKNCTGLFLSFKTDSPYIGVSPDFEIAGNPTGSSAIAGRGFDLYIKDGGRWQWAGSKAAYADQNVSIPVLVLQHGSAEMKECILYLPNNSVLNSLEIVTRPGSTIEAMPNPFKGRICVWGSSYTHGACTSRPGMIYSSQLCRMTGYNFINMGFSGNSKLQLYFAEALSKAENIDAYLFDAFSNPNATMIQERLFPFIEKMQQAKPGVPLMFMKTLFREKRRFDEASRKNEEAKENMADKMMKEAVKKYKNVYWITSTNVTDPNHETSIDGSHPGDYGYTLWAESVKKPVLKVIKKVIKEW